MAMVTLRPESFDPGVTSGSDYWHSGGASLAK